MLIGLSVAGAQRFCLIACAPRGCLPPVLGIARLGGSCLLFRLELGLPDSVTTLHRDSGHSKTPAVQFSGPDFVVRDRRRVWYAPWGIPAFTCEDARKRGGLWSGSRMPGEADRSPSRICAGHRMKPNNIHAGNGSACIRQDRVYSRGYPVVIPEHRLTQLKRWRPTSRPGLSSILGKSVEIRLTAGLPSLGVAGSRSLRRPDRRRSVSTDFPWRPNMLLRWHAACCLEWLFLLVELGVVLGWGVRGVPAG